MASSLLPPKQVGRAAQTCWMTKQQQQGSPGRLWLIQQKSRSYRDLSSAVQCMWVNTMSRTPKIVQKMKTLILPKRWRKSEVQVQKSKAEEISSRLRSQDSELKTKKKQNKTKLKTKKLVKSLENCRKRWKSHKTCQKLSKISDENPNN